MSELKMQNLVAGNGAAKITSAAAPSPDLTSLRVSEQAGALVMQARRAHRKEQKNEAKKLLQQALTLDAKDIGALELLGDIFMEDAEQERALKVFEHGLKHHPGHRAFEEKIAICILDIKEMERHQERSKTLIELGDKEAWMNLSPNRALGLSAMLPGAGHVYAEEIERAAWVFGGYVFTLLGWTMPLYFGLKGASNAGVRGLGDGISFALRNMNGFVLAWFWLMIAVGVGVYVFALFDAAAAVERTNDKRKHGFDEFGF